MKLGLLVESEEGLDWQRWQNTYRAAERLGFESVWLSDHLASPWHDSRHGLEPWIALSVAAAETKRIRLGTLVSPISFRAPALVARMAEALADLSGDRFVLGMGLGWNASEHARFHIPFPALDERIRLLDDGLATIRQVLGERRVPVLIGGGGLRASLPLVARWADEWNLTSASAEVYGVRAERLAELCQAGGRAPGAIRHSIAAGVLVGCDDADLGARAGRLMALVPPLARAHVESVGDAVAAARSIGWLAGTPRQIAAQLRLLSEAGVGLAILGHYDLDDVTTLELIAREIGPVVA